MNPIVFAQSSNPVLAFVLGTALFITSLFMILLVLVQRGKGGGLTGALGGMGGQSAFGTKAGDAFTRITIGAALAWMLLGVISIYALNASRAQQPVPSESESGASAPLAPGSGPESPGGAAPAGSAAPAGGAPAGGEGAK